VAYNDAERIAYKILAIKPEGKIILKGPRRSYENKANKNRLSSRM
jgi:hypothetical protein